MTSSGFKLVWAEDELARNILIEHPELGRQVYTVGSIAVSSICPATGQELQVGWLCYFPPADAINHNQPIGEFAIRQLLGNYGAPNEQ